MKMESANILTTDVNIEPKRIKKETVMLLQGAIVLASIIGLVVTVILKLSGV